MFVFEPTKTLEGKSCRATLYHSKMGQIAHITGQQGGLLLQDFPHLEAELLAHIAACTHPKPQDALILGGFNTEIAFELLRHENLKVDFVQEEGVLLEELKDFLPHFASLQSNPNFKQYPKILDLEVKKYDLIFALNTLNAHQIDGLQRMLGTEGILIASTPSPLVEPTAFKQSVQELAPHFSVLMPFLNPYAPLPTSYLFASKQAHPLADMILQKIDMLEGLSHYNEEIHTAAFAQPQRLHQEHLGLFKN
ncbi:spermidine synthase [Helicobacter ailurogastricus]|uniref:spermine/spermidine synthase domain-containing protein n=1 Tax=Helicobacter ailurogastricus TaxID=1578720 RepID=UPI0022C0C219|nr:spermidine synthase [Helicobacter ailurogastricus]GLH58441.1 Spermidine synthase SpeE [Helicobacter ailurogastricus]GLH59905.1 Spermidine synthase SpeE [Helicobacter ailurogastricus]GMB90466.1 Spermidine synthase SpeE [Helicobacter ailurogastricus]